MYELEDVGAVYELEELSAVPRPPPNPVAGLATLTVAAAGAPYGHSPLVGMGMGRGEDGGKRRYDRCEKHAPNTSQKQANHARRTVRATGKHQYSSFVSYRIRYYYKGCPENAKSCGEQAASNK